MTHTDQPILKCSCDGYWAAYHGEDNRAPECAPIVIAGSAWAIANATTWWGGLIFGLGALLLVLLGVMVAGGAAAHANAEEQAAAVGPEAPDDSAATG